LNKQIRTDLCFTPPNYRRNAWAFGFNLGFFRLGMTFLGANTVLPSLVDTLSHSKFVVGLVSGILSGGRTLPQLLAAGISARHPRKKPLILRNMLLTRPILLVTALFVWLYGERSPIVALTATIIGLLISSVGDALASVPWFELLAKVFPPQRRGRVLGLAQVIGGLLGMGAGVLVRFVLSPQSPWGFPANYSLLFALGAFFFLSSTLSLSFVREPETAPPEEAPPSFRQSLASLPRILHEDKPFVLATLVRIITGFASIAGAFYVLYATEILGFRPEETGLFLSAQVAGSLSAGLMIGLVQDRWGPLVHMRILSIIAGFSPILALLSGPLAPSLGQGTLAIYLLLFYFLGLYTGSAGWPFFNWTLEYAPEEKRSLYLGIGNTLGAPIMFAPTLGGWIAKSISYPAVFITALGFALLSLFLTIFVPSTR